MEESEALQELIRLQREQVIIIKPADKGAGILVMNYLDYIQSCEQHLMSTQPQPSSSLQTSPTSLRYYTYSSEKELKETQSKILNTLQSGLDNKWISKDEYTAMDPSDSGPGKFYQIFKVHKPHPPLSLSPGRPIISGRGSITENISRFVDFHAKPMVDQLPSYIQDTPDFLRNLEKINNQGRLPDNSILVTIDVSALYTNIRKEDGLEALKRALQLRDDKSVPTQFLIDLMKIVLSSNIFEFNNNLYRQEIGTAMGTSSAPTYANILMGEIDEKLKNLALSLSVSNPISLYNRFIDDIFTIWTGTVEMLELFLDKINNIHPTLKFTFSFSCPYPCDIPPTVLHDCFCYSSRAIPFLDTLVSIQDGKLVTDLYRKPTDRCMYLLPSSCHPTHTTRNIPYSLC